MKSGKNYKASLALIEKGKSYDVSEGIDVLLQTAKAKFDESVELHLNLGVDGRNADQQVRGVVVLPNGTGKSVKVLVIAKGDKAKEAEEAGADFVGAEEIVSRITNENWLGFDVCITTPDMMGVVGRIARVLGPKGLMPNPKSGTVTMDIKKAVNDVKAGKGEYRQDNTNKIRWVSCKVSFGKEKLMENLDALMTAIIKAKPAAAKGQYIKGAYLATTMGPAVKINNN